MITAVGWTVLALLLLPGVRGAGLMLAQRRRVRRDAEHRRLTEWPELLRAAARQQELDPRLAATLRRYERSITGMRPVGGAHRARDQRLRTA